MAELIQFHCPACGTLLRLPLAMAARQGPCPNCDREIIAPDPQSGTGAWVAPIPPPPKEIEPFRPFAEPTPEPLPEPSPSDSPNRPELPPPAGTRAQRTVLILSCLLSAALALAIGFALGVHSNTYFTRIPPPAVPFPASSSVEIPVNPAPPVEPVIVKGNPVVEPAIPQEPAKASAAAEAALKAFLDAPDWAARSAYVLSPDKVRGAMEAYSREVPDGPVAYQSLTVKQSQVDAMSGHTLFIFLVTTDAFPEGIPVAIKETDSGWLVDWLAFVEFRDGLFQKFVDAPAGQTGRFHLIVTRPPARRAANTENEHFSSVLVQSPLAAKPQLAFVRKGTETFREIEARISAGEMFAPVLEIEKRQTGEGQGYLEILAVKVADWFPRDT